MIFCKDELSFYLKKSFPGLPAYYLNRIRPNPTLKKQIIMQLKLVSAIIMWACVHVFAESYSQKVTISEKNASLEKVFKEIKNQSRVIFWYESDLLKKAGPVDIDVKNVPVRQALDIALRNQPLSYSIIENTIVINAKTNTTHQNTPEPAPLAARQVQIADAPDLKKEQALSPKIISALFENIRIHGKVTDDKGEGLPGVSILLKGTQRGTITDENGRYELHVPDRNAVLIFSFVGYVPREIAVGIRSQLNVEMTPDNRALDELVVVGYGTVRKSDLTGSVGTVNLADVSKAPVSSFADALSGRIAGLKVASGDGQPGRNPDIVIRGISSLTQRVSPLFVVDGFPIDNLNLATIDPDDIESISVLKDA